MSDLLDQKLGEIDKRIVELEPLVLEHKRLVFVREAIDRSVKMIGYSERARARTKKQLDRKRYRKHKAQKGKS